MVIFEVTCAWDRLVTEGEEEKDKTLATDLEKYWDYTVNDNRVLGTTNLRRHLG